MKISARVECGIVALIDIALYSAEGKAVSTVGISGRQNISAKYLEQILIALKQANLIRGQKGSKGGYVLASSAEKITFDDIINALDVTILCDSYIDNAEDNSPFKSTVNEILWNKMTDYMQKFASNITLADAARECRTTMEENSAYMYYI